MVKKNVQKHTVSKELAKLIHNNVAIDAEFKASNKSVLNQLRSENYRWTDLVSPKSKESTCNKLLWTSLVDTVAIALPQSDQDLLAMDTKELSDLEKQDKRFARQKIGSKLKDYKNALIRDQRPKRERVLKTDIEKFSNHINTAIEILQNTEEDFPENMDLPLAIERLKELVIE